MGCSQKWRTSSRGNRVSDPWYSTTVNRGAIVSGLCRGLTDRPRYRSGDTAGHPHIDIAAREEPSQWIEIDLIGGIVVVCRAPSRRSPLSDRRRQQRAAEQPGNNCASQAIFQASANRGKNHGAIDRTGRSISKAGNGVLTGQDHSTGPSTTPTAREIVGASISSRGNRAHPTDVRSRLGEPFRFGQARPWKCNCRGNAPDRRPSSFRV